MGTSCNFSELGTTRPETMGMPNHTVAPSSYCESNGMPDNPSAPSHYRENLHGSGNNNYSSNHDCSASIEGSHHGLEPPQPQQAGTPRWRRP